MAFPVFNVADQQSCSLDKFRESLELSSAPDREVTVLLKMHGSYSHFAIYFTVTSLVPTGNARRHGHVSEWKGKGEIRKFNTSKRLYECVSRLDFHLVTSFDGDPNMITGGKVQFHDLIGFTDVPSPYLTVFLVG